MPKRVPVQDVNKILKTIKHPHKAYLSNEQTIVRVEDKDITYVYSYMRIKGISLLRDAPKIFLTFILVTTQNHYKEKIYEQQRT